MIRRRLAALTTLLAAVPAARACPVCDNDTGKQVRAALFGSDLGFNILATLLPFLVFLSITAAIYYGFPRGTIHGKDAAE